MPAWAILTSLFILIFVAADSEILEGYRQSSLELLENNKEQTITEVGEGAYEQSKSSIAEMSLFDLTLDNFLRKLLVGLMITIFFSIVTRMFSILRKKNAEDKAAKS